MIIYKKIRQITAVIAVAAIVFSLSSCGKSFTPYSKTDYVLNTIVTVTVYNYTDSQTLTGAIELCKSYEKLLSRTLEGSDIYNINNANGTPVEVDARTAELITTALYYCELSGGLFDITTAPLSDLWGFSSEQPTVPTAEQLAEALKYVNYKQVSVQGNTVTLPAGYKIDLGAIAKGYIADRLREYLAENGVENAIIDLGGNIYALGKKEGSGFKIGIKSPQEQTQTAGFVQVSDCSVVTSGTYERCFEQDGIVYHHILNVSTGMPANTGLSSVTILASDSVDADALSTVCFLLGKEKATELLENTPQTEGIFITEDGEITTTSGTMFTAN